MEDMYNEEIKYLTSLFESVKYDENRFKINYERDKFIFGFVSSKQTPISKIVEYGSLYDTLVDIDLKIKLSLNKAIEFSYSDSVVNNFDLFSKSQGDEMLSYYYIENAIFRISSLWDILAQFYCLFYNLKVDVNKVYYNKIFNPNSNINVKFKEKAEQINDYLNEEDNTKCEDFWKGNHRYLNKCRNKMTHRNSPNITVISKYDINMKDYPTFMLKRIIEDYSMVSRYLVEILDLIEEEIIKINGDNLLKNI